MKEDVVIVPDNKLYVNKCPGSKERTSLYKVYGEQKVMFNGDRNDINDLMSFIEN